MPVSLNIELQRNEDWSRTLSLADQDNQPIDITGCSFAMQVREKLTQNLVTEASVSIADGVTGLIDVRLPASEGSALGEYGTQIQVANLHYDFRMIDTNGAKIVLFGGLIILSRGETRQ